MKLDDSEFAALKDMLEAEEMIERHLGPGPHPGTGTEQQVHAGEGLTEQNKGKYPNSKYGATLTNKLVAKWAKNLHDFKEMIWLAGFGGFPHKGKSATEYVDRLWAEFAQGVITEEAYDNLPLNQREMLSLRLLMDSIFYEIESRGMEFPPDSPTQLEYESLQDLSDWLGDDPSVLGIKRTHTSPTKFVDTPLREWDSRFDYILKGIEPEVHRRLVMREWVESDFVARSANTQFQQYSLEPEGWGLHEDSISSLFLYNAPPNVQKALIDNFMERANTPGTIEYESRFEGETIFDRGNRVIHNDNYQWYPRDEGPELEQTAAYINRGWQQSTHTPISIVAMEVASEIWGGEPVSRDEFDEERYRPLPDEAGPEIMDDPVAREETAVVLRNMYDRTQDQFRTWGLGPNDTVRIYRGLRTRAETDHLWNPDRAENEVGEFDMWSLSSWSASVDEAMRFAEDGVVIAADMPVTKLLANHDTGMPCKSEYEWIVVGGEDIYGAVMTMEELGHTTRPEDVAMATAIEARFNKLLQQKTRPPKLFPDRAPDQWNWIAVYLDEMYGQTKDERDEELMEERAARTRDENAKIFRHGDHVGQEGTPEGGSQPGYTHVPGSIPGSEAAEGPSDESALGWNPEDDNFIIFGKKLSLDEKIDELSRERFGREVNEILREFYERTGIKPKGLTITNSYIEMAKILLEREPYAFPGLNAFELAGVLWDKARRGTVGMYEAEVLWLLDNGPDEYTLGGEKWNYFASHELGHWIHNDVLWKVRDEQDVPLAIMEINSEIKGSGRYIEALQPNYGEENTVLRREYVADLIAAFVGQEGDAPKFNRFDLGELNEGEKMDMAKLLDILKRAKENVPEITRAFRKPSPDRRVIVFFPGGQEALGMSAEEAYGGLLPDDAEIVDPAKIAPSSIRRAMGEFMAALNRLLR